MVIGLCKNCGEPIFLHYEEYCQECEDMAYDEDERDSRECIDKSRGLDI